MPAGNGVCNTIYGDPAVQLTYDAWGLFRDYAVDGFNLAAEQTTALNNFQVEFHTWDASFAPDGSLTGFLRPARPVLGEISTVDLTGQVPDAPTVAIQPLVLDTAPAEPAYISNPPDISLTVNAPAPLDAQRPDSAPDLEIPEAPAEPTIATVLKPTMTDPTIPDSPTVTIDEFVEAAPEFDAPVPSGQINFTEEPYISTLLDGIRARITAMMAGEGLPPQVEEALFGRLVQRDDESANKLVQEVREEFSSRGFEALPNGIMDRRMIEVRRANRDKRAEANRDVYIQAQTVVVENIRFAVSNGIQLEGNLIQAHMQVEQRKFDLAVKIQDVALAVFNARVSAFNGAIQAYNARIAAYQAFLEGQKARVEIFKAQMEGAKLQGEMNEIQVRIYEAEVRAELQKVEIYKAQVDGFRGRIDAERTKIEAHRSEVEAYKAFVEAYKVEWDAERTRIEAEVQRGRIYQSLVEGYSARVNIWQTKGEGRIQEHRANLVSSQALLQQHEAQIRALLARLEASKANVQAQVAKQDATVRVYQIDAQVEDTAVNADTRAYQALADRENMRLQVLLKDAELQVQQLTQRANLLLRAMESSANASSQLAASALSAVNMSASVSSGSSRGESCSTAFSYSGEIADA